MSTRIDRLNSQFQKEISNIIQFQFDKEKIGFVTVSDVIVSADLSYADVYVSIFLKGYKQKESFEYLEKEKGLIRSELAHRIDIRKIPEIRLHLDDSLDKIERIENIVNKKEG